jgi:hypothetical protein
VEGREVEEDQGEEGSRIGVETMARGWLLL